MRATLAAFNFSALLRLKLAILAMSLKMQTLLTANGGQNWQSARPKPDGYLNRPHSDQSDNRVLG